MSTEEFLTILKENSDQLFGMRRVTLGRKLVVHAS